MNDLHEISVQINAQVGRLKSGSLRFYGDWFGRPMDNFHSITTADSDGEILHISFDEGERLSIWAPTEIVFSPSVFRVGGARKVRWEWYYYGKEKTPENQYYLEYTRDEGTVVGHSNVDWYQPSFLTVSGAPAVEIS